MYQNDRLADPQMDQTDLAAFELSDEQLATIVGGDGYAPPNGNPYGTPDNDGDSDDSDYPGYPGYYGYPGYSGYPGYPGYAGPFGYGGLGVLLPLLGL